MKIEVSIEKRYAFLIVGILILIMGGIAVYAYTVSLGTTPNPGHTLASIQGYFSGDTNLQTTLGKFCQTDGTNCPAAGGGNGAVTGSIVGWGIQTACTSCDDIAQSCSGCSGCNPQSSTATCSGGTLNCPASSTKLLMSFYGASPNIRAKFVCVKS